LSRLVAAVRDPHRVAGAVAAALTDFGCRLGARNAILSHSRAWRPRGHVDA
jgi:hypothetical protein